MLMSELRNKVLGIIREFADDVPDDPSADLLEQGIINSLGIMNILSSLEADFDIEVDGDDITKTNFKSIDAMVAMVEKYIE